MFAEIQGSTFFVTHYAPEITIKTLEQSSLGSLPQGSYEAGCLVVIKASKWETCPAQWNSIPKAGGRRKRHTMRGIQFGKRKFARFFFCKKKGTYVKHDVLGSSNVGRGMGLRGCDSDSLSESVGRRPDEKKERTEGSRVEWGKEKPAPLSTARLFGIRRQQKTIM